MSSTRLEPEGSSSARELYMVLWWSCVLRAEITLKAYIVISACNKYNIMLIWKVRTLLVHVV